MSQYQYQYQYYHAKTTSSLIALQLELAGMTVQHEKEALEYNIST